VTFEPAPLLVHTRSGENPGKCPQGCPAPAGSSCPAHSTAAMVPSLAWQADPAPYGLFQPLLWPSLTRPPLTAHPRSKRWDLAGAGIFISSMPTAQPCLMLPTHAAPSPTSHDPWTGATRSGAAATPSPQLGACWGSPRCPVAQRGGLCWRSAAVRAQAQH